MYDTSPPGKVEIVFFDKISQAAMRKEGQKIAKADDNALLRALSLKRARNASNNANKTNANKDNNRIAGTKRELSEGDERQGKR